MDPVPSRALAVARGRRGLVLRDDLVERAGVSQSSIRRYLRRGDWVERLPGVIDLRTHGEGWRHELTALALAAGPDAWASHGSAAYLHRFLDADLPSRPHIQVPRGRHAAVAGVRLHTTRSIGRDEVTQVAGLPSTTRARTLLDLAASTSPERLERYLANLARRSPNVIESVVTLTDRHRHAPGRQRLLRVVRRLPGDVAQLGSPLEVIGVQRLRQLGAPAFVLQYPARDRDGAVVKRVDVAWQQIRTILEFDGADYHDLTGARAEDQRVRDHLRALGWVVEVVCRADLDGPRLRDVVGRVRAAVDGWGRATA